MSFGGAVTGCAVGAGPACAAAAVDTGSGSGGAAVNGAGDGGGVGSAVMTRFAAGGAILGAGGVTGGGAALGAGVTMLTNTGVAPAIASRRSRTVLRVFIDEAGLPRQVLVNQSSGFARLDEAATTAVQKARFKPYSDNGQALAAWALVPLSFDLEK